jgi:hypothetical protein
MSSVKQIDFIVKKNVMDIFEKKARLKVEEYARKGEKMCFDDAKLLVRWEMYDSAIRVLIDDTEMTAEKIASCLGVSVRFVQISINRYAQEKACQHL